MCKICLKNSFIQLFWNFLSTWSIFYDCRLLVLPHIVVHCYKFCVGLNQLLMKCRGNIWSHSSTRAPNVGTRLYYFMVADTTESIVGSVQHKMFNCVVSSGLSCQKVECWWQRTTSRTVWQKWERNWIGRNCFNDECVNRLMYFYEGILQFHFQKPRKQQELYQ